MESNFFHSSLIIVTFMNISIGNCALSIASGRASVADNRFTGSSFMMNRQLADTESFPDSVMNSYGQVCLYQIRFGEIGPKGDHSALCKLHTSNAYTFKV